MRISDLVWVLPGEGHDLDGEFITRTKHGDVYKRQCETTY